MRLTTRTFGPTLRPAYSGHGEFTFEGGGARWTVTPAGDLDAKVWATEKQVRTYGAQPWLELSIPQGTFRGQATEPPTMDEHGRVCFHLMLSPLP